MGGRVAGGVNGAALWTDPRPDRKLVEPSFRTGMCDRLKDPKIVDRYCSFCIHGSPYGFRFCSKVPRQIVASARIEALCRDAYRTFKVHQLRATLLAHWRLMR